ncbi:MAG: hypothetical protein WEB00_10205 [Dehalococcoidia bacterium]
MTASGAESTIHLTHRFLKRGFRLPRYDSTKQTGAIVCAGSATLATAFVVGLLRRSYWTLAIPVVGGVVVFVLVAVWVGLTLALTPVKPESELQPDFSYPSLPDKP